MNPNSTGRCWHCNHQLLAVDYAREGRCPGCDRPTHLCRNCRFYQPGRANDCSEPVAEPVLEKARANFCDYFEPHEGAFQGRPEEGEALRAAAEALFRQ